MLLADALISAEGSDAEKSYETTSTSLAQRKKKLKTSLEPARSERNELLASQVSHRGEEKTHRDGIRAHQQHLSAFFKRGIQLGQQIANLDKTIEEEETTIDKIDTHLSDVERRADIPLGSLPDRTNVSRPSAIAIKLF